jgi:hypothetical protein
LRRAFQHHRPSRRSPYRSETVAVEPKLARGRLQANVTRSYVPEMKLIATSLSIGMLLLPAQAQEPQQDRRVIHLTEVTCKTFVEEMKQEQGIIVAWLQGYYIPENEPPAIDVDKLVSDSAKLTEHCLNNPEDDVMMASEAVFGK